MRKIVLALSFLAGFTGLALAQAQVAPPVQQSSTRSDAATLVGAITSSGSALAVNTTTTSTLTAPAGQFVYITGVTFEVCTNGTGTAQNQVTFTSTNISNTPSFQYSIAATASICQRWSEVFVSPLKSQVAGTNVTFVSPSAAANNSYNIRAYYYNAP
jgi:hypothetical protein